MSPQDIAPPLVLVGLLTAIAPMIGAAALWAWRPPDHRGQGSIALATTWNATLLLALNALAVQVGWWHFVALGPTIAGVPLVLWFGWTILWGTVASQAPLLPLATLGILAVFDLIYMPLMSGVVILGQHWLVGEAVLLGLVAYPSLVLVRWSNDGTRLRERAILQMTMFAFLLAWVLPTLAVAVVGQELRLDIPPAAYGVLLLGLGGVSLPGAISVHDFYLNGGTPWPWESTSRPVRSGPYRYVRSPMQASGTLVLASMSIVYREPVVGAAALGAMLYSNMFCWMEETDLGSRFGSPWSDLAKSQRRWWPSWRPSELSESAIIWIDLGCEVCSPVAEFFQGRSPIQLQIADAREHPKKLTRVRYERDDGASFSGVAAVGAALEHLSFGWAMIGWLFRLPGAQWFWVLVGDAVGFGPRSVSAPRATSQTVATSAGS